MSLLGLQSRKIISDGIFVVAIPASATAWFGDDDSGVQGTMQGFVRHERSTIPPVMFALTLTTRRWLIRPEVIIVLFTLFGSQK